MKAALVLGHFISGPFSHRVMMNWAGKEKVSDISVQPEMPLFSSCSPKPLQFLYCCMCLSPFLVLSGYQRHARKPFTEF